MNGLVKAVALGVVVVSSARAGAESYQIERFPFPSNVPGIEHGDFSAVADGPRLVAGYDADFAPVGIIMLRDQAQVFTIQTPDGAPWDYAWYWGINDRSTTVGFGYPTSSSNVESWIRTQDGSVQNFADPNGDVYLYRLNDQNVAVGEIVLGPGLWRPVIADADGLRRVDPAGVDPDSAAYFAGINNAGAVVGGATDPVTFEHTCLLWERGGVTAITHDGAGYVAPRAINNRGQVAGWWHELKIDPVLGEERGHGFIRDANSRFRTVDVEYPWQPIIEFPDGEILIYVDQTTKILDINDRGQIVIEATGWYDFFGFVMPVWTYAIATPAPRGVR